MKNLIRNLSFLLLILSALYISGCSGGGGSSTETANVTVTSNVDDANVSIYSYNADGSKERDSVEGTMSNGTFEKPIKMDKNGGYLVVNVTKDGYVDWSKKINFNTPQNISVNAVLTPIQSQSIVPLNDDTVTVSSTGQKVIKIALIKRSNGEKVIAAGNQIRALNGIPEFSMEIPRNAISSNIKALKVGLSSFNPEDDADKFPGDYVDENGKRLISLGFNYVSIKDENGNPVFRKSNPSASQTYTYRITRWIDDNVCENLQGDFCTGATDDPQICSNLSSDELNGYNVPFYRYDDLAGVWELLGVGTIDKNFDNQITSSDAVDSSFDAVQTCQNNNGFNTIIVITDPDFTYCNLDYPIVTPPTELCIEKVFKDNDGQPFTNVFAWLEDDDNNQSFLYSSGGSPDQTGTLILKTWNVANDGDTNAKLYYQYSKTVGNQTVIVTKSEDVTLGTDPTNCPKLENTIDLTEKLCKVQGAIEYEGGSPAENVSVFITDDNLFYVTTVTDENGNFEATVLCETPLIVFSSINFGSVAEFEANGTVDYDEQSDEEQAETSNYKYIVTLQTITVPTPEYPLYVFKQGNGTVTSNPAGIYCGTDCNESYEAGTTVTLTATPDNGNYIDSWAGCDNVSSDKTTCTVTMNSYRFVSVTFKSNIQYTLHVSVSGNGSVVSNPAGINCIEGGGTCTKLYDENAQVTLTAIPENGYIFNGWGGDCSSCGTNTSCSITMDSNKNCSAEFAEAQTPSVDMTGVWEGSYTGNDGSTGQICVELQQTGNNLSGSLYIQGQGLAGSVTGTLSGNNIEFGIAAGVQYSGTVSSDGNSASGTYDENGDGTDDGNWSITKSNKTSCGWISSEIAGDMSEYLPFPPGIVTEVPTVTVNNNGTTETDWYAVVVEYVANNQTVPYMVLEKSDRTALFSMVSSIAGYLDVSQNKVYSGTSTAQFLSNQNYGSTPIYQSECIQSGQNSYKYSVYQGTATISLPQITLTNPQSGQSRTFSVPSQDNITAYKVEYTTCQ